jgi:KDO2-lipid IV(A) lauroyltransferase
MQSQQHNATTGTRSSRRNRTRRLRNLRWYATLFAAALMSLPFALLPTPISVRLGSAVGTLAYYLLGRARRIAVDNIAYSLPYLRTLPEWQESHGTPGDIARRSFANMGKTAAEVIKLMYGFDRGLAAGVQWRGTEHYHGARARGKGVLFITGHCDNWELVAHAFGLHHDGMAVVARKQKFQPLTILLENLRTRTGNSVIYTDGAARGIYFRLKKNEAIGILMDQSVQPRDGALVKFLGRKAWTTTMPATIATRTGAAMVPGFGHREGSRHVVTFYPEIVPDEHADPAKTTLLLNRCIDRQIARYPDQWLWAYRRWKRSPEEKSASVAERQAEPMVVG